VIGWPRVERAHLAVEPACAACGPLWQPGTPVQVHHIFPVHFCRALGRPDLELDPRNLLTLCSSAPGQDHHLLLGYLGDFLCANPSSRADAARFRGLTAEALQALPAWRAAVAGRVAPLTALTRAQRSQLRAQMDEVLPPASR